MTEGNDDPTTGDGGTVTTADVLRVLSQAGVGVSPAIVAANDLVRELDAVEHSSTSPPSPSAREDAGDVYALTDRGRDYVEAEPDAGAPVFVD